MHGMSNIKTSIRLGSLTTGILLWSSLQIMAQDSNHRFTGIVDRYFEESAQLSPVSATRRGDHRLDSEINDVSAEGRNRLAAFYQEIQTELASLKPSKLSRDEQIDRALLEHRLKAALWSQQELEEWAWNPLVYSGLAGGSIYSLMARDFAPLPDRLRSATARLEKLPTLYAQTRTELQPHRVPKIHAETAIGQNRGLLSIIKNTIEPEMDQLNQADRGRLTKAIKTATTAMEEHQRWLEDDLLPQAKGEFRIGKDLFDQKLAWTLQSSLTREQIRDRGLAFMNDLHERM